MKSTYFVLAYLCSFALIVGCAKTDDAQPQAGNSPATQPSVSLSLPTTAPTTQPDASMLVIGRTQQWFPPARLRLSTSHGKVIARLYSDDPKDVLTGKAIVNSYDLEMELPEISNPDDLEKTAWIGHYASMEKQNTPYGIFLNNQQQTLQPLNAIIEFKGHAPNITVMVQGTFGQFSNDTPNPAPVLVRVMGVLQATVPASK